MNADAYLAQLKQLLPPGQAWAVDGDSTLNQLLTAMAKGLAQVDARANDLIDESDLRTTLEMLKSWENVAGLPNKCSENAADTVRERQDVLTAKITGRGGQSRQYFIDLAKALGYDITITEYRPFQVGQSAAGDPLCSENWAFVWRVNAPTTTIRPFRAGEGATGEPLNDWGNEILECSLIEDKPAHTLVFFAYGD